MDKSKPFFSVITVCRNAASSICGTADSLLCQSFKDYEYLVIDGASTDNTVELVNSYSNRLPLRLISEPDSGIYDAMNKAVDLARGEWVFFLNSADQFAEASVLQRVADTISSGAYSDLVYGDIVLCSADSASPLRFNWLKSWNLRFEFLCHQAVFGRTALFRKIGSFDLTYKVAADYDWLLRACTSGAAFRYLGFTISLFDMNGLSQRSRAIIRAENANIRGHHYPGAANRLIELLYRIVSKCLRTIKIWKR